MRFRLLILLLPLASCASVDATPEVPLGQEFTLAPAEVVLIAGTNHLVTFNAVTEDSRCPRDVACIWEGNARVSLTIREAVPGKGEGTLYDVVDREIELNTSGRYSRAQIFQNWSIELRGLEPAPLAGTKPATYRATFATAKQP